MTFKSIGHYESENFDPQNYDPIIPNPAFENATMRDAFWAARIIMTFTDDLLRAAVETGQYTEPGAAEFLIQRLIERRDIAGRYVFDRINPLDCFELQHRADGAVTLHFTDLAVSSGLALARESSYRIELIDQNDRTLASKLIGRANAIEIDKAILEKIPHDAYLQVKIATKRLGRKNWSMPTIVYLAKPDVEKTVQLLGLRRIY